MFGIISLVWTLLVTAIHGRLSSERGATAVEYGLLVALIAAVIIGTVSILGGQINTAFDTVVEALPGGDA